MNIRFLAQAGIAVLFCMRLVYADGIELNWKRAGTHKIPCLHGRLTLLENMKALFGQADLTESIKKRLGINSAALGMVLIDQGEICRVIQVMQVDTAFFNRSFLLQADIERACEEITHAIQGKSWVLEVNKYVTQPYYDSQFKTFFASIVMSYQDKEYVALSASVVGNKVITIFMLIVPARGCIQFNDSFVSLVNSFKYDTDFACQAVVLSSNQEKIISTLILLGAILLAYLCLYLYRKRENQE